MAPTAKLTTGPGVPRAETIREQFCEPTLRREGRRRIRRAREGSLWLVGFQAAKERVYGKRKEYRAKSRVGRMHRGTGETAREGCSSPIIGKLKAVTHLGTTSIRLSLGQGRGRYYFRYERATKLISTMHWQL